MAQRPKSQDRNVNRTENHRNPNYRQPQGHRNTASRHQDNRHPNNHHNRHNPNHHNSPKQDDLPLPNINNVLDPKQILQLKSYAEQTANRHHVGSVYSRKSKLPDAVRMTKIEKHIFSLVPSGLLDQPKFTNFEELATDVLCREVKEDGSWKTPSMEAGFSAGQELERRQECALWIVRVGEKVLEEFSNNQQNQNLLNGPRGRRFIAVALSYMHKYFDEVSFAEFSVTNITTACLYLAGKVEEHRVPIRHIILHVHFYTTRKNMEVQFVNSKKEVLVKVAHADLSNVTGNQADEFKKLFNDAIAHEYVLLQLLGFHPEVNDPFTFIHHASYKKNHIIGTSTEGNQTNEVIPSHIMEGASFLCMQFYMLTPLCSSFSHAAIALAMIHVAAQWPVDNDSLPLKFPKQKKTVDQNTAKVIRRHWWQYNFPADNFPLIKELHDVTEHDILEICDLFYDVWWHSKTKMNIWAIAKYNHASREETKKREQQKQKVVNQPKLKNPDSKQEIRPDRSNVKKEKTPNSKYPTSKPTSRSIPNIKIKPVMPKIEQTTSAFLPPPNVKSNHGTPKEEDPPFISRGISLMEDLEVSDESDDGTPQRANTSTNNSSVNNSTSASPREQKKSPTKVYRQSSKSDSSKSRDRVKRDRSKSQEKREKHSKSKKSKRREDR